MHNGFADWYRAVSIEPRAEELQKRWQGVEAFAKEANASDVPLLARLFGGAIGGSEPFLERFRAEFKKADDAFPMQRNNAELQVLAGATLVALFEYDDEWGLAAALAIMSTACGGLRSVPVPAIVQEADNHLQRSSLVLRTESEAQGIGVPDLEPHLQALAAACQSNTVSNLGAPLSAYVELIGKTFHAWVAGLQRRHNLFREECDVLWWVFGGHSRDLSVPFGELKEPCACLVAAKELADLVRVPPGPYAAEAFLDTVVRQAHPDLKETVAISVAVDACPTPWRTRLTADRSTDLDDVSPIHLALRKSVDGGGKGWQSAFHRASHLKASEKMAAVDLATQVYRECLLQKVMGMLQETQ